MIISLALLSWQCFTEYYCRHADGSVSFWDVSLAGGISLLCTLDTSDVFALDSLNTSAVCNGTTEEEWPPFRKVHYVHAQRLYVENSAITVLRYDCSMVDNARAHLDFSL